MKIEFTLRGLLSVYFRQRKKATVVFAACVLAAASYLCFAKTEYESSGSLLVKFGSSPASRIQPNEDLTPDVISQNDRREIMESDIQILQSHNLLLSLVHEFGVERLYPGITAQTGTKDWPEEVAVHKLWNGDLSIKSGMQSDVIQVSMLNRDPTLAAQFVSRLFSVFMARQSEIYNKPQIELLAQQVTQAKSKLDQSQAALQTFRAENNISSLESELDELLRQKSDVGSISLQTADEAWMNLNDLQAKEQQMLQTYRRDAPQVQELHQSVVLAEKQLKMRESDLNSRTGQAKARIDKRIAELEGLRTQYNNLERQVDIDEQNYKNYQLRSEDARIDDTLNRKNITSISIIDEPLVPKRPARPRKTMTMLIGLLAGLVFGSGIALAAESMDPRFSTPRQVSLALGVPVMASFDKSWNGRA